MKKDTNLSKFRKKNCSLRYIRSFSCRQRKLTKSQKYAIENYWPLMGIKFNENLLNYQKIFGRTTQVTLEIGFGSGTSLVSMAKQFPEQDFIGVEVYTPGVGTCLTSAYNTKLENLRIIHHDAVEVLHKMIPDKSLSKIQLFFPDIWQKRRHNKRRIVQIPFIKTVKNKLKLGGIFHLVTDWKPYAEHTFKVMSSFKEYENQSVSKNFLSQEILLRPRSKFEQRSLCLGLDVWELLFKKVIEN